ncbi:hypothetical protein DEU56DRAFT_975029 [Suillus clintonianus]|uniref:uncharacterized protein n=1 Tax=Suillus clintonianus TaxID=1904413 RepID=UPI001B8698F3|nr:uncharacterized protein DEU56DRAFT_975029 [Suillus clintonianus]KAG2115442.1 hypothetical protein DEU56DRAFT_975029 [Suillus clintonianus]
MTKTLPTTLSTTVRPTMIWQAALKVATAIVITIHCNINTTASLLQCIAYGTAVQV